MEVLVAGRGVQPLGLRKDEWASFTVRPSRAFCAKHALDLRSSRAEFAFAVKVEPEASDIESSRPASSELVARSNSLAPAADTPRSALHFRIATYN